ELQVERRRASACKSAPESVRPCALTGHKEAGRALVGRAGWAHSGWARPRLRCGLKLDFHLQFF
ncbi:hypothetical protein TIFTF001_052212, partial [Ficus carica]